MTLRRYTDTVFPRSMYHDAYGPVPEDTAYLICNLMPELTVGSGHALWSYRPSVGDRHLSGLPFGGTVQLVFHFKTSGSDFWFAIANGQLFKDTGSAWSEVVTGANFTTAGITLSTSATCYAIMFNDEVVVSDGTNTPWTWDGTSGAGGLTNLSNAPVAYGKPTEYYGKLFFISAADRREIQWSEEYAPNTGYDATGYNNAWTLTQNDPNPLVGIQGTNSGLYYFREQSIGLITGAVTPDFATTGVDDLIQAGVGLASPAGVAVFGGDVYFADRVDNPASPTSWRVQIYCLSGGALVPLWQQVPDTSGIGTIFGAQESGVENIAGNTAFAAVTPWNGEYVLFWVLPGRSSSSPSITGGGLGKCGGCLVVRHLDKRVVAVWQFHYRTSDGLAGNADNSMTAVATDGKRALYCGSSSGYVFATNGLLNGRDTWFGSSVEMVAQVVGREHRPSTDVMIHWDEIEVHARNTADAIGAEVAVQYLTSEVNQASDMAAALTAALDSGSTKAVPMSVVCGIDGAGRWIRPVLTVTTDAASAFSGLAGYTVRGYVMPRDPAFT